MEGSGQTVLVVDDDSSIRLLCRINLELEGHRVLEAATVASARELLESERIDVVLLDIHLGADSGFDLLETIRAGDRKIGVALLTGSSPNIPGGAQEQADAIIRKPFELDELAETVRRLGGSV